ncbi:ATP synthase subunit I [Shouchella lonarensis]|uniref:ATP synthase protein I n=1 Tax=Shouchella lonarensis TaxID=1464122 RepID=A0A1G6GXB9_9BACI|nr:ATP synthase subunit I [Shouchella lonarensis]SDB86538.1 ATP synthase protein I [Shouchella lonarensis]
MAAQTKDISLQEQMRRYTYILLAVLGTCTGGYFIMSSQAVFLGIMVGFVTGYLMLWTMYRHAQIIGGAHTHSTRFGMFMAGLGFVVRIMLAVFTVALSLKYPTQLDTLAVLIGLGLVYAMTMIEMMCKVLRRKG